jgi:hypothetical protein
MLLRLHASGARPRPTLRRLEPSLDRVAANLRAISEVDKESAIAVAITSSTSLRGRACHSSTRDKILSVTLEIKVGETSIP